MCGRYALTSPAEAMREIFKIDGPLPNLAPQYNIAPSQQVPIIRWDGQRRLLERVRWGLVPSWMRVFPKDRPQINARSETIADKPMFRAAYHARRCLVPTNGFYEWRRGTVKDNHPFLIHAPNHAMFAMAGIWETWTAPDGSQINSMAIVTKEADPSLKAIHHRMPVVLSVEDYGEWLQGAASPPVQVSQKGLDKFDLKHHPVSIDINKASNDRIELLTPVDDPADTPRPSAADFRGQSQSHTEQYSLF